MSTEDCPGCGEAPGHTFPRAMRLTAEQAAAAQFGLDAVEARPFDPAAYYGEQGVPANSVPRMWPEAGGVVTALHRDSVSPNATGDTRIMFMSQDPLVNGNSVGGPPLPPHGILLQAAPAAGQALGAAAANLAADQIAFNMMLILFARGRNKCDASDFGAAWDDAIGKDEDCAGLAGDALNRCKHRNNLRKFIRDTYALIAPAQKNAIWWEVRRRFIEHCKKYSD